MAMLVAVLLVLPLTVAGAGAASTVDFDAKGTISITLGEEGVDVTLYQVGQAMTQDSNLYYELLEPLAAVVEEEIPLNSLTAAQNVASAAALWEVIQDLDLEASYPTEPGQAASLIPSATVETDGDNTAVFTDLPLGIYLAVQTSRSSDYYNFTPFLIPLPMTNDAGTDWEYEVAAEPKLDERPDPDDPDPDPTPSPEPTDDPGPGTSPTPEPSEDPGGEIDIPDSSNPGGGWVEPSPAPSGEPQPSAEPSDPGEEIDIPEPTTPQGNLPQTGMLQWPVPLMAMAGLVLFCVGWMSERKNRRKE